MQSKTEPIDYVESAISRSIADTLVAEAFHWELTFSLFYSHIMSVVYILYSGPAQKLPHQMTIIYEHAYFHSANGDGLHAMVGCTS